MLVYVMVGRSFTGLHGGHTLHEVNKVMGSASPPNESLQPLTGTANVLPGDRGLRAR